MSAGEVAKSLPARYYGPLFLVILLLLAAGLRLYRLNDESLWYDEAVSWTNIDAPSWSEFIDQERILDPPMTPVYFTLEYVWAHATRYSLTSIRLLSVLLGLGSIVLVYFVGSTLFSRWAGLVAAMCVVFAKPHIYYSQEIRMYALLYAEVLLAMFALIQAEKSNKRIWWCVNLLANGLILWTHLLGGAAIVAQGVFLLLASPRSLARTIRWGAALIPIAAPLLWWFRDVAPGRTAAWIPEFNAATVWRCVLMEFPGVKVPNWDTLLLLPHQWIPGLTLWALGACFLWAAFRSLVRFRSGRRRDGDWFLLLTFGEANRRGAHPTENPHAISWNAMLLLLSWLFVPALVFVLLSLLAQPCFVERYFLYSSYALYLIVGGAVAMFRSPLCRAGATVFLVLVMAMNAFDIERPLRPDFMRANKCMSDSLKATDAIFMLHSNAYYLQYPTTSCPLMSFTDLFADTLSAADLGRSCWLLFKVDGDLQPARLETLLEGRSLKVDRYLFPGTLPVACYRLEPYSD